MTHDPNCIFCKIVEGQIPSKKVYEDEEILAFHDIHPWAPVHFLLIPKEHVTSMAHVEEKHAAMLGRLAGRTHEVISALWLVSSRRELAAVSVSQVRFAALDAAAIAAYVGTGEPFGKAGGYAIQGRGAALVEHLAGSYSGVMGLPLFETAQALREFAD